MRQSGARQARPAHWGSPRRRAAVQHAPQARATWPIWWGMQTSCTPGRAVCGWLGSSPGFTAALAGASTRTCSEPVEDGSVSHIKEAVTSVRSDDQGSVHRAPRHSCSCIWHTAAPGSKGAHRDSLETASRHPGTNTCAGGNWDGRPHACARTRAAATSQPSRSEPHRIARICNLTRLLAFRRVVTDEWGLVPA